MNVISFYNTCESIILKHMMAYGWVIYLKLHNSLELIMET